MGIPKSYALVWYMNSRSLGTRTARPSADIWTHGPWAPARLGPRLIYELLVPGHPHGQLVPELLLYLDALRDQDGEVLQECRREEEQLRPRQALARTHSLSWGLKKWPTVLSPGHTQCPAGINIKLLSVIERGKKQKLISLLSFPGRRIQVGLDSSFSILSTFRNYNSGQVCTVYEQSSNVYLQLE